MKILLIGTSDRRGGAAIASFRLFLALKKQFNNAEMLVRDKFSTEEGVIGLNNTIFRKSFNISRFIIERILFIFYMKSKDFLFLFSPANIGQNIIKMQQVKEADIIHLHWTNQGFLSLKNLEQIFTSKKRIIWTLHDMWVFTGGCHHAGECDGYLNKCGKCPLIKGDSIKDLSFRIFKCKEKIFKEADITFVSPSEWLAEKARRSSLIGRFNILVIPNPLDIDIFKPGKKLVNRKLFSLPENKFIILTGSVNLKTKNKGFKYLIDALKVLSYRKPEIIKHMGLVLFGKSKRIKEPPIDVYPISYVKDEKNIVMLYQLADIFILPSLEENLPNMIMESLSCGTPVIAFKTGGIPELIEHKSNGYLAEKKNIGELCDGILWAYENKDINNIRRNCREKVVKNYSSKNIAKKYFSLYKSMKQD